MLKLDLSQDLALLKRIQVKDILNLKQAQTQLSDLKSLNVELVEKLEKSKQEQKEQLDVISKQNEVIQKYRQILSELTLENSIAMEVDVEEEKVVKSSSSSSSSSQIHDSKKSELKNVIEQLEANTESLKKKRKVKKSESDIREKKAHRLNELIDQQKIKYPSSDDDYPDTSVGQLIWDTILRCFQKLPGNFITEMDIINEGGKCLLEKSDTPFLDHSKITTYFNYPFKYKDSDKTIVIKEYVLSPESEKKSWVVLMPPWFSESY